MIILVIDKTGEVESYSTTPQAIIIANQQDNKFLYEQTKPIAGSRRKAIKQALEFARLQKIEDPT